jgi:hypothetical protein
MADAMETLRKVEGTAGPHEPVNIGWARPTAFSPRKPPTEAVNNLSALSPAELERACVERELMVFDDILEDAVSYRNHAIELCRSQGAARRSSISRGCKRRRARRSSSCSALPMPWEESSDGVRRTMARSG